MPAPQCQQDPSQQHAGLRNPAPISTPAPHLLADSLASCSSDQNPPRLCQGSPLCASLPFLPSPPLPVRDPFPVHTLQHTGFSFIPPLSVSRIPPASEPISPSPICKRKPPAPPVSFIIIPHCSHFLGQAPATTLIQNLPPGPIAPKTRLCPVVTSLSLSPSPLSSSCHSQMCPWS